MSQIEHHTNNTTAAYARWIVRWRWAVIALSLLVVFAIASGGRFVGFTGDYHVFFSEDNPQMLAFETLEKTYTKDDNVLLILAPKNGNVFTRETLDAIEKITKEGWQTPYSTRVDSITNFQYTHAQNDDLIVGDLVENARELSDGQLAKIRDVALHEPMLVNRLVSPQAHVAAVNITVQLPGKNPDVEMPAVTQHVTELIEQIKKDYPQLEIHPTGIVLLNNAFFSASMKDMSTLVPLMFLIVLVFIGILLRSWAGTFATFWVIVFSILAGMGFSGWAGIKLTPPSSVAPTIILTLAVADAVHILLSMLHAMRLGMNKHDSIVESLRINMQPVFLTSLTTAIGFLTMNFSDSPPFHDLGNIVSVGVVAAFFLSITFLPAVMAVLPVRTPKHQSDDSSGMLHFAEFVIRHRTTLLWGTSAVVLVLAAMVPRNQLSENFVEYFDHSVPFRVDSDFASKNLGGMYRIDYSLDTKQQGGVSDPEFLKKVEAFADWYRQQPETIHVNSLVDTMKRLNKNMHGDDDSYYTLPADRNLAAQYLLLYEMSLPYGLDLNNQINVNKSATRMTVTIHNIATPQILALEERAQAWFTQNAPEIRVDGSSTTIMFSHIGMRNIKSMILGTSIALVLISLILVVALRSLKIGLISLIPNLAPAAMGFGVWGLLISEVNVGLSIVTGMTLGIVVDDTVHFLSKYMRARREKGLNAEDAVRYAFSSVGKALWVTSAVLVAGFLVLTLSSFKLNSSMGLLTSIVIVFALATDFLLLPTLLMKLDKKQYAAPQKAVAETLS